MQYTNSHAGLCTGYAEVKLNIPASPRGLWPGFKSGYKTFFLLNSIEHDMLL